MSVPRLLVIPTHRTGLADAITAAVAEIVTAQGHDVRYHHVGPAAPMSAWDRWEGAVFVDPALTNEQTLLSLYDVAVRHAEVSLLSASTGLLDRRDGCEWAPADLGVMLDCPLVAVLDCRGWGTGLRLLVQGLKASLPPDNLAGVILTGVADEEHRETLKRVLAEEGLRVAGCLMEDRGLGWDAAPPGAWGLPLPADLLERVSQQVDVGGLLRLAGQRGFLATRGRLSEKEADGPLVMVASGTGFTPWSRDSIEVLRACGAKVRRLDLLEEAPLPSETAGLVLAGTLWPDMIPDIAMNLTLLRDMAAKVVGGLPTLAMGGGMLLLLSRLQDTLGRTSELAGVVPAEGEILWDLEEPAYVEVGSTCDNVLLARGDNVMGWVLTELELRAPGQVWESPLALRGMGASQVRLDSFGTDSLLCSPALVHMGVTSAAAGRFVDCCAAYAARVAEARPGNSAEGQ